MLIRSKEKHSGINVRGPI